MEPPTATATSSPYLRQPTTELNVVGNNERIDKHSEMNLNSIATYFYTIFKRKQIMFKRQMQNFFLCSQIFFTPFLFPSFSIPSLLRKDCETVVTNRMYIDFQLEDFSPFLKVKNPYILKRKSKSFFSPKVL